ncbi:MAG: hypothetical protein ACK4V4_06095 [Sphingobacteriales bacterium]|jgi:hypothetical protein
MKKAMVWVLSALLVTSCQNTTGIAQPEDGEDAGREFIRAVLDGDYVKAQAYIVNDEEDVELYKRYVEYMRKLDAKELIEYKQSNITIHEIQHQGDTTTIMQYSNSATKTTQKLKVVKRNDKWLVDFSYTFVEEKKN